ncbi:DUF2382 domain-containing protein [Corynebacterium halotolerans]|nr:DUF2382 domain-containing protein [Corynebacterium halotolerans]
MSQNPQIDDLFRATAYDSSGEKLGAVRQVYLDNRSGQPSFIEVSHGLFGMGDSLVPLRGSRLEGEQLDLAFPKEWIKDAPEFESGEGMTGDQENKLLHHYGVESAPEASGYRDPRDARDERTDDGGSDDRRGEERREEERREGERRRDENRTGDSPDLAAADERAVGEAQDLGGEYRLRKYVVTETRTIKVPVTREEVRVERVNEDGTVTPVDDPDLGDVDRDRR